jgi:predicted dithiol-disulfide oxidoreductase (DUF899 family)
VKNGLAPARALLTKEKELTRACDALSAEQRVCPGSGQKEYVFDALPSKITLADLFADHSQLFIKHFMMGPAPHINVSDAHSRSTLSGLPNIYKTTASPT